MKFRFFAHGLLLALLLSAQNSLFAAYAAVADLPKIELNRGGSIKAVVELPDGGLIIGGLFTRINGKDQAALARIKPDGTLDENWDAKIVGGSYPRVDALVLAGDSLYVGGYFRWVGGELRVSIARVDTATGKVDLSWNPYQDGDTSIMNISSLLLSASGEQLFVGGYFDRLGGVDISAVAKVSTLTAEVDPDWNPQVKQGNERVYAMLLSGDDLYIGGQLTEVAGVARHGVAKLSATGAGTLDSQWDPKIVDNWVYALAISANGEKLYLGGDFSTVNGATRKGLVRVSTTGTGELDAGWDANATPASNSNPEIRALFLAADGLYVGGSFGTIGGQARNNIARLSTTDASADDWNPDAGRSSDSRYVYIYSIVPSTDGSDIHLGGTFLSISDVDALAFASVGRSSGAPVAGFTDLQISYPGEIHAMARNGNSLYFGGDFVRVNGKPLHFLGKWDIANQELVDWDGDFDDRVLSIAVSSDGNSVYAGGYFNHAGGLERNHLAKLASADAQVDTAWNPDVDSIVETLLMNGNDLYIGGSFHRVGSVIRQYLARLAADTGNLDATWYPHPDNSVYALALSGTDLFAGGYFSNIGGQSRSRLAKIDTGAGNADPAWQADADNTVKALTVSGSALFAGGYFRHIGGQVRNHIARLSTSDGSIDSWDLALNSSANIGALATNGTDLYLGGRSFQIGGSGNYRSLAKVAVADGAQDTEWDPQPKNNKDVLALLMADSGIYAGGKFTGIGGKTTALAHIVDGHMLTLAMTATNSDAYRGMVISEPEGMVCEPHSTALQECKRAFTPGAVTLKTVSNDPNITLSQEWLSGCATGGGATSSCALLLDTDRTVEMTLSCESHDVPAPDEPVTTFSNVSCNNIQVIHGYETGDGGRTTFTATNSVILGPGFRVSNAPGFFKVQMQ